MKKITFLLAVLFQLLFMIIPSVSQQLDNPEFNVLSRVKLKYKPDSLIVAGNSVFITYMFNDKIRIDKYSGDGLDHSEILNKKNEDNEKFLDVYSQEGKVYLWYYQEDNPLKTGLKIIDLSTNKIVADKILINEGSTEDGEALEDTRPYSLDGVNGYHTIFYYRGPSVDIYFCKYYIFKNGEFVRSDSVYYNSYIRNIYKNKNLDYGTHLYDVIEDLDEFYVAIASLDNNGNPLFFSRITAGENILLFFENDQEVVKGQIKREYYDKKTDDDYDLALRGTGRPTMDLFRDPENLLKVYSLYDGDTPLGFYICKFDLSANTFTDKVYIYGEDEISALDDEFEGQSLKYSYRTQDGKIYTFTGLEFYEEYSTESNKVFMQCILRPFKLLAFDENLKLISDNKYLDRKFNIIEDFETHHYSKILINNIMFSHFYTDNPKYSLYELSYNLQSGETTKKAISKEFMKYTLPDINSIMYDGDSRLILYDVIHKVYGRRILHVSFGKIVIV